MTTMYAVALKCSNCGGPLRAGPDDILTVCEYCGNVYPLVPNATLGLPSVMRRDELERKMFSWLKGRGVSPTPVELRVVVYPFYVYEIYAKGKMVYSVRTKRGKKRYSKSIDRKMKVAVPGRKEKTFKEDVISGYVARQYTYSPGSFSKDVKYLSVNKREEEAREEIEEKVEEQIIGMSGNTFFTGFVYEVEYFDVDVDVKDVSLLPFPLAEYRWREGKRGYITLADASNGRVFYSTLPMSSAKRMMYVGASALSASSVPILDAIARIILDTPLLVALIVSGGLSYFLSNLSMRGDEEWVL